MGHFIKSITVLSITLVYTCSFWQKEYSVTPH